jgi:nickel-dependent lactate racemase
MEYYLNYEGGRMEFSLPSGWNVLTCQDCAEAPIVPEVEKEINRALDNPIGTPRLEQMARPGMNVMLIFDDAQRPTPAHLAIPPIMNRLNAAGILDERISGICAVGTHSLLTMEQLEKKVGKEAFSRLQGRIFCHDPHSSENVLIGRTHRGTMIEINRLVAKADMNIGVGECMPHPCSGFGGGCKIILPGVSSYRAVADHHYTYLRHPDARVNVLDGNPFYEEIVDAARLSRLRFKLDFIMNEKRDVIRAFAGDPVEGHRKASEYARSLYLIPLEKRPDVVITSASPLEIGVQVTKALMMAGFCVKAGGTIIWVASQKNAGPIMPLLEQIATRETAGEFHHRLIRGDIPEHMKAFGISYIMMGVIFKEVAEKVNVVHVTEGLTKEQVAMMHFNYAPSLSEAIQETHRQMPRADVAIFPSGGNIIPGVH